jgi:hypothetical protein
MRVADAASVAFYLTMPTRVFDFAPGNGMSRFDFFYSFYIYSEGRIVPVVGRQPRSRCDRWAGSFCEDASPAYDASFSSREAM